MTDLEWPNIASRVLGHLSQVLAAA
jgi:hypothetical protein